jgi:hypothetical protein
MPSLHIFTKAAKESIKIYAFFSGISGQKHSFAIQNAAFTALNVPFELAFIEHTDGISDRGRQRRR